MAATRIISLARPATLPFTALRSAGIIPRRIGMRLASDSAAPATIVQASFWKSLVPKPLRKENRPTFKSLLTRQWNPATFFIVIFLFIGSMSIQMIALRHSFDRYMRQSQVKIALLRDVVERIQRGEEVDVEKALGTGNAQKEADWEEMLRAIEQDDAQQKAQVQERLKQETPKAKVEAPSEAPKQEPEQAPAPTKSTPLGMGSFF